MKGVGSALHALMYVLSERLMNNGKEKVSAKKYCALYGAFACLVIFIWQVCYTRTHFNLLILEPAVRAGTTLQYALVILSAIALMSMMHSITFFHTVKHRKGGATSAGILKVLQAVLVFGATSLAFCHKQLGSQELCFTYDKMISLCIVVSGVVLFGKATEISNRTDNESSGYKRISSLKEVQIKEVEMEANREYHQV